MDDVKNDRKIKMNEKSRGEEGKGGKSGYKKEELRRKV